MNDSNFDQHSTEKTWSNVKISSLDQSDVSSADRVKKNLFENVDILPKKSIQENIPQANTFNLDEIAVLNTENSSSTSRISDTASACSKILTLEETLISPVKLSQCK